MAVENNNNKRYSPAVKNTVKLEEARSYTINDIIAYSSKCVVVRPVLQKLTGSITVMSFDNGQGMTEKTFPFDSFSQIIDGKAEIVINKISHFLESGMSIIIPAHAPSLIKPNVRFKMILTIIKNGYE